MKSGKQPHILNASSNLLGICFIIITGLKLTKQDIGTIADEISMLAALGFMLSCLLSYLSIRWERLSDLFEIWADYLFLSGMMALFFAILIFATGIL